MRGQQLVSLIYWVIVLGVPLWFALGLIDLARWVYRHTRLRQDQGIPDQGISDGIPDTRLNNAP